MCRNFVYNTNMATITIPKNLIKNDDLVIIPRKEYEEFYQWKEAAKLFKTFTPTVAQKEILREPGKIETKVIFLTIDELKHKLGFTG